MVVPPAGTGTLNGVLDGFATGFGVVIGGFTDGLAVGGCGFAVFGFLYGIYTIIKKFVMHCQMNTKAV